LEKKPPLKLSRIFSCDAENNININIKINLKLVIRKSDDKILFAQGEQDFADFLLSFLTFPLGGVARILGGNCSMGCIDALYKSIVDLDEDKYLTSIEAKNRLVDPHFPHQLKLLHQILPIQKSVKYSCYYQGESFAESLAHNQFFISDEYISDEKKRRDMCLVDNAKSRGASQFHKGYVKGLRTYAVTDNLVFTPASPISALYLVETPLNDLKEKLVTIGIREVRNNNTYT